MTNIKTTHISHNKKWIRTVHIFHRKQTITVWPHHVLWPVNFYCFSLKKNILNKINIFFHWNPTNDLIQQLGSSRMSHLSLCKVHLLLSCEENLIQSYHILLQHLAHQSNCTSLLFLSRSYCCWCRSVAVLLPQQREKKEHSSLPEDAGWYIGEGSSKLFPFTRQW